MVLGGRVSLNAWLAKSKWSIVPETWRPIWVASHRYDLVYRVSKLMPWTAEGILISLGDTKASLSHMSFMFWRTRRVRGHRCNEC